MVVAVQRQVRPITGRGEIAVARGAAAVDLAAVLGHDFRDWRLLTEALTHSSAAGVEGTRSYERLEFLGDRVLALVIADVLLDRFPDETEGDLARRHAALVRREAVARVAEAIELGRYLTLATGESGMTRDLTSLKADALEAVMGAIYLDGGLNAASAFIERHWAPLIAEDTHPPRDPKTSLQEWAQARALPLPRYQEVARAGPDHAPHFTVRVSVQSQAPGEANGRSKRAAEQEAAANLLAAISENDGG